MKNKMIVLILLATGLIFLLQPVLFATQEDEESPVLGLFSNKPRPPARFDHEKHEESLEEEGCGVCHHVLDEKSDKLIYEEGEETSCLECHINDNKDDLLTFRDANHASCTGCHRTLKKSGKISGPTTCGECHQK